MGFLDKAKRSLTQAVDRHGDTIAKNADQVGRIVNQRTGNQHERTVAKGTAAVKRALEGREGRGSANAREPRDGPAQPRDVPAPREPRDTDAGPAAGRS